MKHLARIYPWLLISPAILPVVVWGGLIYPYLVPKTLLFYTLALLTAAAFSLLAAYGTPFYWGRLREPLAWVPGALLVLAYVASIFGIDFYRSFWSLFVRGDGLLMLTCAVSSFYLILLYANRPFFSLLLRAVAIVGGAVALYGVGEWVLAGGRIGSLLGNAAFFAGYLGIALFATLAVVPALPLVWRRGAYAAAALEALAIVLSATRGTILALGIAALAALGYVALKGAAKGRRWAGALLIALVVLAGAFFALRSELATVPFAPIQRIATIGLHDPDVSSRLFIWRNMVGQIEKAPVLGVGAEHIDVLFNRFYDPTQIQEEWFDRSHNAFLDYAAQYGLGGLALYLALIYGFFVAARRLRTRGEGMLAASAALLAITYAVQNFFVFDTISSFWLLLALLAAFLATSGDEVPAVLPLPRWARPAAWVKAAVLVLLIIPVSIYPAIAAYDLAHAYAYALVDPTKEIAYLSHGFALGTYGNLEYGYEVYDMYANNQAMVLTGDARVAAYTAAFAVLAQNAKRYPYDARTALYLAHVLSLAPPGISIDKEQLAGALATAIKESPKRYQPWYVLVNLSITQANTYPPQSSGRADGYAAARDLLNRYIAIVPTLAEPHFVLAEIALATGDTQAAASEAALGKQYYTNNVATARRAASLYESMHDWPDAAFFLDQVVSLDPSDVQSRYNLAKVLYLGGNPAASLAIVIELRQSNPNILTTDPNFLAAITAYERSQP